MNHSNPMRNKKNPVITATYIQNANKIIEQAKAFKIPLTKEVQRSFDDISYDVFIFKNNFDGKKLIEEYNEDAFVEDFQLDFRHITYGREMTAKFKDKTILIIPTCTLEIIKIRFHRINKKIKVRYESGNSIYIEFDSY